MQNFTFLLEKGFTVIESLGFIVCLECKIEVRINNIYDHLKSIHKDQYSRKDITSHINKISTTIIRSNIYDSPSSYLLETIPYLDIFDGIQCLDCLRCFKSNKTYKFHISSRSCTVSNTRVVSIQSLNIKRHTPYFPVYSSLKSTSENQDIHILNQTILSYQSSFNQAIEHSSACTNLFVQLGLEIL